MVNFLFSDIIDTKIVDDERESDGLSGVLPERRSSGNRDESKMGKMSFESVVGDAACLFEAWHAFADLEVNPSVGTK